MSGVLISSLATTLYAVLAVAMTNICEFFQELVSGNLRFAMNAAIRSM